MADDYKVAVITGATSNIGRAICARVAESGFTLVACDTDPAVSELARNLREVGAAVHCFVHDVTNEEDWVILKEFVEQELGSVHTLVNNSILNDGMSIVSGTKNDWNHTFEANVLSAFLGMRALVPLMRGIEGASVINVSASPSAPGDIFAAHSASKWALRGLTKSAALEFTSWGIRVNAVFQGATAAGMPIRAGQKKPDSVSVFDQPAHPEEIAAVVGFLAGADSRFLTGVDLIVDAGWKKPLTHAVRD